MMTDGLKGLVNQIKEQEKMNFLEVATEKLI